MFIGFASTNQTKLTELNYVIQNESTFSPAVAIESNNVIELTEKSKIDNPTMHNAIIKAVHGFESDLKVITDDERYYIGEDAGVYISALRGKPGCEAQRYLGTNVPYSIKQDFILSILRNETDRTVRIVSSCALLYNNKTNYERAKSYQLFTSTVSRNLYIVNRGEQLGDREFGMYSIIKASKDSTITLAVESLDERMKHNGRYDSFKAIINHIQSIKNNK